MSKKNERNANGKYESSALVGRIRRRFVCLCNNTRRQSSCVRPMIANSVRWTLWKFSKQKSKEFYSSDGIQNKRFLSDICLLKFKTVSKYRKPPHTARMISDVLSLEKRERKKIIHFFLLHFFGSPILFPTWRDTIA